MVGTYGAIYSVGIQVDRNAEMRQGTVKLVEICFKTYKAEMVGCMRELFQQVREEIHALRIELSEVKAELQNLTVSRN